METTTSPTSPASRGLREAMRQRPLLSFFIMAYAFSWIFTIPCILMEWGYLPGGLFELFFGIKAFAGPFVAGFMMTRIVEGREGVLRLRRSLVQVRAGWPWYLLILLGIPALTLLGIVVQSGALASFSGISIPYLVEYLVMFVIIFFLGGPLAEEAGWRGFALPRMQQRYGPLVGALLLGLIWTFWHLPDFLTRAQGGGPGTGWGNFFTNLTLFAVLVLSLSILLTWVYNHTNRSIFIAMLLHASLNTSSLLVRLFPIPGVAEFTVINLAGLMGNVLPALLIVGLTKGRLGWKEAAE